MLEVLILIVLAQGVVFAALCGWLAGQKHRDVLNWIVLGFLFGLIALLVLGFAPSREHGMNTKASTLKGELNRCCQPSNAICKDFVGWTYFRN